MEPKYKRILLKLSGEAMAGEAHVGLDFDTVLNICKYVKEASECGSEIAIVVGGGNFWRGRSSGQMDRTRADHMGMLATTINALGLADALEHAAAAPLPDPSQVTHLSWTALCRKFLAIFDHQEVS